MMHQALDDSDQTRKYGISDPQYKPFITTYIVCNKVIIRACIMDSEMPYFLVDKFGSRVIYDLDLLPSVCV